MNSIFRPTRDFSFQTRTAEKTPEMDDLVKGHLEGVIANYIQTDSNIQYTVEEDTVELSIESEMLTGGKTRGLLKELHQDKPHDIADFSQNNVLIQDIIRNARDMVFQYENAELGRQQTLSGRTEIISAPEEAEEAYIPE
ncbi:MAG: hypothetical protein ACRBDL_09715 [Alphaproteobacteria bacterium]